MSDSLNIRKARATEAAAIAALVHKAYSKWIAVTGREPLPMQVNYSEAIQAHDISLIEIGGELVGLIEAASDADSLLIVNVAVEPASQGQGIGRRLIAYAEDLARSKGLMRTRLFTNRLFAKNIMLYASLGYDVDREEVLNGGVAVHMSKSLD